MLGDGPIRRTLPGISQVVMLGVLAVNRCDLVTGTQGSSGQRPLISDDYFQPEANSNQQPTRSADISPIAHFRYVVA
jgi:hypothetical protein